MASTSLAAVLWFGPGRASGRRLRSYSSCIVPRDHWYFSGLALVVYKHPGVKSGTLGACTSLLLRQQERILRRKRLRLFLGSFVFC